MVSSALTVGQVATLAHRASMSSSYKPALLKALLRIATSASTDHISLETIGAEYLRLYWVQTVVFRLRQAANLTKEPEVVQAIRHAAAFHGVRNLHDLEPSVRIDLEQRLARILTMNVLDAFHASKPEAMPLLFWWARFLEKVNQLAPRVIQKLNATGRAVSHSRDILHCCVPSTDLAASIVNAHYWRRQRFTSTTLYRGASCFPIHSGI